MKCPTCGQICRTDRETCALCGTPLKQKRGHGGLIFALLVIVALALAGLAVWLLLQPAGNTQTDKTALTEPSAEAAPEPSPALALRDDALFTDAAEVYARERYTLALCTDGTVKLAGQSASPEFGFDLFDWQGIVQLIPEDYFIFALTRDGRVRMTGEVSGYEAAAQWTGVQRLYYAENGYGLNTLLGLTADGHVLAAGPELDFDPSQLQGIVDLIPSGDILAVNSEGRVTVLPRLRMLTDAQGLYGVADVALHSDFAFYLMEDGSIRPGSSYYSYYANNFFYAWEPVQTLRVGDTYFTATYNDLLDGEAVIRVAVTVNGEYPEYTVPTGLTGKLRKRLSSVELPAGFSWTEEEDVYLGELGEHTFKAKYTPEDLETYAPVENIDIVVETVPGRVKTTHRRKKSNLRLRAPGHRGMTGRSLRWTTERDSGNSSLITG